MGVTKSTFLGLVKSHVSKAVYSKLMNSDSSPLTYAIKALRANTDANDIDHSYRVAYNCFRLAKIARLSLTKSDYLILLYASLLHDISKTVDPGIGDDITETLLKRKSLFSDPNCDHGVRSAHYIEQRQKDKLEFYGLKQPMVMQMCRVIAFHSSAIFHSPFQADQMHCHDVLLCLLFWVSDVSDGVCERVAASATAQEKHHSDKVKAREQIDKTTIDKYHIKWIVQEEKHEVKKAAQLANNELSKHKLLLQAFRLPSEILITKKSDRTKRPANLLLKEDLGRCGLSFDLMGREAPLQISEDTLFNAYESIVEAFQNKAVKGLPGFRHYFGPLLIEIRNIKQDSAESIIVRNNQGLNIDDIKKYTMFWLDDGSEAAHNFYFGYTHGQRLKKYVYAKETADLDNTEFYEWHGKRKQLESIVMTLKQGKKDARRAYAVIAHPVIDDSDEDDKFYTENIVQPSLVAIHFRVEAKNKLSAFAFLRSQEMSTFFLVNYFELKELITEISKELSLKHGRIVMTTSLAYFDMDTTLLDKPLICKQKDHDIRDFALNINNIDKRSQLKSMLKQIKDRTYILTEYDWCSKFIGSLPSDNANKPLIQAMEDMEGVLKQLSKQQFSTIPKKLIKEKEKSVQKVIDLL